MFISQSEIKKVAVWNLVLLNANGSKKLTFIVVSLKMSGFFVKNHSPALSNTISKSKKMSSGHFLVTFSLVKELTSSNIITITINLIF